MNDRELAVELMKIYSEKTKSLEWWHCTATYNKILEDIRTYRSNTTLGKIEELIDEYDKRITTSEFIMNKLIDNIRKLVKGGVDNEL